jgi:hypothetical protein
MHVPLLFFLRFRVQGSEVQGLSSDNRRQMTDDIMDD